MSQSVSEPLSPAPPAIAEAAAEAAPRRAHFAFWHEAVLIALLVGVLGYAKVVSPDFLVPSTQWDLLDNVWDLALLAVPMTLIIITGGIDLSIGSTMALAAVVMGLTFSHGHSIWLGAVLAILVGLAAGALNGLFITRVKVHPLLVTLATQSAFRGIAQGISLGRSVSGFPDSFTAFSKEFPALLFIGAALLAALVLAKTPFGLNLYGIGHNEKAMRFSGWNVDRAKFLLYTLAGGAAGLAAIEYAALRQTTKADIESGIELNVITVVVLGGTSIYGGRGSIFGTLLGLLLIHELREFVSWHWQQDELINIVVGVLLIASVLLHSVLTKKERK